ncbi:MAG: DNA-directed RNA polymerase subunit beta' [Candidatus Campbellbacteria bacterium]|nr:DNA-directed RNA polymerase subunit beta' [Candidatus Campbellbacteria bacterium]
MMKKKKNNMENKNIKKEKKINSRSDFESITLSISSPEEILNWSRGEIKKAETINYRTQRAEKDGLFDERVFGTERNYECSCGKYRDIRYKGIVCDKCGVEVTHSGVRRNRMGHIELAAPVAHIWYLKSVPSRIALMLGVTATEVQSVVYFGGYMITDTNEDERKVLLENLRKEYTKEAKEVKGDDKKAKKVKETYQIRQKEIQSIQKGAVIREDRYYRYVLRYSSMFKAGIGGEIVYEALKSIDLRSLEKNLVKKIQSASKIEGEKMRRRLSLVRSFIKSKTRPEWMFFLHLPIIPAGLRPMVALDGGRYATSDINDLYRRIINRNIRLKRLISLGAPEVILRNEKRLLQEAVDALLDNSIRSRTNSGGMRQFQKRELKSLAEHLGGKRGCFRSNLLGKRVDYSGRSVIVAGPELKLNECGIPKEMALELFKPFVMEKLFKRDLAYNIRAAGRLIDDRGAEVWKALEEVVKEKYVLLNRAPTLHRQGLQAFKPLLIETKAIQLHPLVCKAFNADFDGDQMAVHVPLMEESQFEAKNIMAASQNVLNPGDGEIIASPNQQDMALGCYWMTKMIDGAEGEGKLFTYPNEAISAYEYGAVDIRAKIKVLGTEKKKYEKFNNKPFETTVGRLLFNTVLPDDFPFINELITKKYISKIISDIIERYPLEDVLESLDKIKRFGFKYSTVSGASWSLSDTPEPKELDALIDEGLKKSSEIIDQYRDGLLSSVEQRRLRIEVWHGIFSKLKNDFVMQGLDEDGSTKDIIASGARGSAVDLTYIIGIKGIIASAKGMPIETPIISSYKKGLNPVEYFIDGYGGRKGLSDSALKTSESGYFGRRLFDVAQDVIINSDNCRTTGGFNLYRTSASGIEFPFYKKIKGRYLAKDVVDSSKKVIAKKGEYIDQELSIKIDNSGVEHITARSPISCKNKRGVCKKCYGDDPSTNKEVDLGEAVGTIAAQAIGEPGTQLTMNTVHFAGAYSASGDITTGLPRVVEIFENRTPKSPAVIAMIDGIISDIRVEGNEKIIIISPKNDTKASKKETEYSVNKYRHVFVNKGDEVKKGKIMTDGSINLSDLYKYVGKEATQKYMFDEITKIYELQGRSLATKHFELILKQMFSSCSVKEPGDTLYVAGDLIEHEECDRINEAFKKEGRNLVKIEPILLGITKMSIFRPGFLSAASFQNTTYVLIRAALNGTTDHLEGLKENVITGRLLPAGTGYKGSKKHSMIADLQKRLDEEEERRRQEKELDVEEVDSQQ